MRAGSAGAAEDADTENEATVCEDPVAAGCGCASAVGSPESCTVSSASDAGTLGVVFCGPRTSTSPLA